VTAYQWAVLLSGASAFLGLLREVLIVGRLGLGTTNDQLQFALSITYTVALLGEPLRSASLNLLGRRTDRRLSAFLVLVAAVAAVVTTVLYAGRHSEVTPWWIVAAGLAGALNLGVAWVAPRSVHAGPFLPAHAITVMPNLLMVGVLVFPAPNDLAFAGRVVAVFLIAPILQLVLFRVLRPQDPGTPGGPEATIQDARRTIGWHGVAAIAGMGTQYVIRTALATGAPGTLSAFVLVLRGIETIRAVFVDTFVSSRLRKWAEGRTPAAAAYSRRLLPAPVAVLLLAGGLVLALKWQGMPGTLLDPAAVVLVVGLYPMLLYRVVWQSMNTNAQPVHATRRTAAVEAGVLALTLLVALIPGMPAAVLSWVAYVVRPVAGLAVTTMLALPPESG
jgi:hypothetical protein